MSPAPSTSNKQCPHLPPPQPTSAWLNNTERIRAYRQHAIAERIAVESYSEILRWLGDNDPTTRKLVVDILKTEEDHADDMKTLLERMG